MPKGYHHLTYDQTCQIYILKGIAKSLSEIASVIVIHKSTVSRELKRNSSLSSYNYIGAQEKAIKRKSKELFQSLFSIYQW